MEVEFNPGLNVNAGTSQPVARQKTLQPPDTTMSIGRTQALEKTLQATPQIRPEAVARAGALVADEGYPSDQVLARLAGHLAENLGADNQND
jgi:hypothetical protein